MGLAMRRHDRFLAQFPSALLLTVGYAYTAIVLGFGFNLASSGALHRHYGWEFAVVSALFAVWHFVGYLGYVPNRARKTGYLLSAAWLGGFSLVLYIDGVVLAAGYVAAACLVAMFSYWRYPRHSEAR